MPLRTRRWNDPPDPGDGYRVLVCRYRPRGVAREGEPWDIWMPELGPSPALHGDAYGKQGPPIAWEEYTTRYLEEMKRPVFWLRALADRVREGETVTLLCSSACTDEARCHRTLLAELLERSLAREVETRPAARVVRRTRER